MNRKKERRKKEKKLKKKKEKEKESGLLCYTEFCEFFKAPFLLAHFCSNTVKRNGYERRLTKLYYFRKHATSYAALVC